MPRQIQEIRISRRSAMAAIGSVVLANACHSRHDSDAPVILFSRIPQADPNGRSRNDIIEGSVKGARPDQRLILYAKSGKWWVQPLVNEPFTRLRPKTSTWTNATHLGTEYAALLVDSDFPPQAILDEIPGTGGPIAASAVVPGAAKPPSPILRFAGYEWRIRDVPSGRGSPNIYDASNAWVDETGALHLRIAKTQEGWTCAEISLTTSLGYGTYEFTVRNTSNIDPAAVFGMFTFDYAGDLNNREMDIEISRWGGPANKNAQYVVQPYYVPENVERFEAPPGKLIYSLTWQEGRATFRTMGGGHYKSGHAVIAEHTFTSGIPTPGIESARIDLYAFGRGHQQMKTPMEVVVEQFTYLP
jgi:hypothetical protein